MKLHKYLVLLCSYLTLTKQGQWKSCHVTIFIEIILNNLLSNIIQYEVYECIIMLPVWLVIAARIALHYYEEILYTYYLIKSVFILRNHSAKQFDTRNIGKWVNSEKRQEILFKWVRTYNNSNKYPTHSNTSHLHIIRTVYPQ